MGDVDEYLSACIIHYCVGMLSKKRKRELHLRKFIVFGARSCDIQLYFLSFLTYNFCHKKKVVADSESIAVLEKHFRLS